MTPEAVSEAMTMLRPRLHRYCARMMGSAFDGEDVAQEALAKAAQALAGGASVAAPEPWLFRIAHNAALDALRQRRELAEVPEDLIDPTSATDRRVAARAALTSFLALGPTQRAAVALIDVLGHSGKETADILGTSLAAVKAALHRGRARLRETSELPVLDPAERARLGDYADRFNAHDWDALRALLAEDVRLDLVARTRLAGAGDVGVYFTRYAERPNLVLSVGVAEGRAVLLAHDRDAPGTEPAFVVLLDWQGDRIAAIRDFHYARYVMETLAIA